MTGREDRPERTHHPIPITITSASRAADGAYLALADLAAIAAGMAAEYRIVGGHMVTLLTIAHGVSDQVPLRETLDADIGAHPEVVADPRLLAALHRHRYRIRGAGNRFVRHHDDAYGQLELVIDVLAPSYRGGLRTGRQHGDLVVDEIPGLSLALSREPTTVDLHVRLSSAGQVAASLSLPDLISALCIKALAYRGRYADKDAVDLWRLVNAAHAAGISAGQWPTNPTGRHAAEVLTRFFGRPSGTGLAQMSAQRSDQARMRAMVRAITAGQ